jgi:CheY-like chemotaxis protein
MEEDAIEQGIPQIGAGEEEVRRTNVLVVKDNADNRQLLVRRLRQWGAGPSTTRLLAQKCSRRLGKTRLTSCS